MTRPSRPLSQMCLVEVTGVAGAGKSTVTQAMCAVAGFRRGPFLHARTPAHLLQLVSGIPRVTPLLIAAAFRSPRMSWRELKLLVYVTRWVPVLRREARRNGGVTVLDQGPIYALVRLRAEGKPFTATRAFGRWSGDMLHAWTRELTAIVWLDASDDVLWRRINGRDQSHTKKGEGDDEGYRFITHYRDSFDETLHSIEALGGPTVLRFDTEHTTPEDLAVTIRQLLNHDHA